MMSNVIIFDGAAGMWRQFATPHEIVVARERADVPSALTYVETAVQKRGLWAAGFLSYEAAPVFDTALRVHSTASSFPLLWFGLFKGSDRISLPASDFSFRMNWEPTVTRDSYNDAIAHIKNRIADGDTYQVNFSFRLRAPFEGSAYELFLHILRAQASRNGAFIEADDFAICSASPELFFSLDGKKIVTRPMKGTAPRGLTLADDNAQAEELRRSEKNRAENLMIVDMMRNDLGRIADVGTVEVPSLFDVEKYPTLWQLTSTVTAQSSAPVAEIMKALFPCASVTGAPKARTMEIIARLESSPRHIYTGAIGFIAPNRKAQFNVAIRTVLVDKKRREAEYGVGGGVVWASTAEGEYEECLTKARILTDVRPSFDLFETLLYTPQDGFFLLDEHLCRLKESAEYFDRPLDEPLLQRMLNQLQSDMRTFGQPLRVRLTLHTDGSPTFAIRPVDTAGTAPVRVKFATAPVDSHNLFLYHKTTYRALYDEALASVHDCDDVVLWNERGEVTESTVANIVAESNGELCTPPVECGLLGGTLRKKLVREGKIREKALTKEEFMNARRAFLINSVRKWRELIIVQ